MKSIPQQEADARKVYDLYWDSYLHGDTESFASTLDDGFEMIGTSESEVCHSKTDGIAFLENQTLELAGKTQMRNRRIEYIHVKDLFLVNELSDVYVLVESEWVFYSKLRLSTWLRYTSTGWKVAQQHGSFPDARVQEGETLALEKISKENLELRDAIKRRTTELEIKNRELEIESSLERVRTVAMAMRKPDNMLEVCRMIAEQLEILGIKEIRNVQTAIIDEHGKGTYMNYQYFKQYAEGSIEEVEIAKHPAVKAMIQRMQESPDAFHSHTFVGSELDEWKQYRKEDNQYPDPILDTAEALHFYFYSIGEGGLGLSAYIPLTEADINVFHRFRNVFTLAYQRFRDIELVEAQAKEAQIELAMERVRARTMAMQRSEELQDTSLILFHQLKELGEPAEQCTIGIVKESEGVVEISATLHGNIMQQTFRHNINEPFVMSKIFRGWKDQQRTLIVKLKEEELQKYNQYRNELVGTETFPVKLLPGDRRIIHVAYFSKGMLALSTNEPRPAESLQLLERFAKVFEQTYTRFLDLQKAEIQAKEAQIEASLERVRSRTMAMQKSDELKDVIKVVFEQFVRLHIQIDHTGFVIDYKTRDDYHIWIADKVASPAQITIPYFDCVYYNQFNEAKEKCINFFATHLTFEEKNKFYHDLFRHVPGLPEQALEYLLTCPGLAASTVLLEDVCLYIENFAGIPYTDVENNTLMRFGNVFQQTYTRFHDLQKAEAQAREAQIELGLERVRARAMAMQSSHELSDLANTVFKELTKLDFALNWCIINIIDESSLSNRVWAANPDIDKAPDLYHMKFENYPFHDAMMKGYKERAIKYKYVLEGLEKEVYDDYLFNETEFRKVPKEAQDASRAMERYVVSFSFSNFGGLQTVGNEPLSESNFDILERFGKVFDLTYTRFNDLQKAETQARESQIEVAIERVRAQAMAMHQTNDLDKVNKELFNQLTLLEVTGLTGVSINLIDENGIVKIWDLSSPGNMNNTNSYSIMFDSNKFPTLGELVEVWKSTPQDYFVLDYPREKLVKAALEFEEIHPEMAANFKGALASGALQHQWNAFGRISNGLLSIDLMTPPSDDTKTIVSKMAGAFNMAYMRFLDLQKAEAQTQKVKVEVALERVRARALAMQEPEELVEVAQVMRHEMGLLGVEELETSSIYIHDEGSDIADCWYAIKDIRVPEKKLVADHITMELHKTWVGREMLEFYNSSQQQTSIVMQGANRIAWIKYCSGISDVLEDFYGEVIPDRTYHLYKFSNGAIGAAAEGYISEESWELLRRATSVFSLAYSRFKDLTQARVDLEKLKTEKQRAEDALAHLKTAQTQLIQSEKMASLGELTAGIAHEIQNPLNFVNNFSEVSNELVDEMKEELAIGNKQQAMEIAGDVKQNLEKILHHGKRADAIVKGMLQHSRTSSGVKEPTDINALADEYLRLAYHGMRAKDKSFNATLKTDYDETIGLINIVPQDIGRVILNLINNAFQAVSGPSSAHLHSPPLPPEGGSHYTALVSVSTKCFLPPLGGKGGERNADFDENREAGKTVEISISDNGPGIPDSIKDKIFQPFFTTKPTGQGTGLGLSLSYDIVKAHGGELKVETKEGEGTTFTIHLPVV